MPLKEHTCWNPIRFIFQNFLWKHAPRPPNSYTTILTLSKILDPLLLINFALVKKFFWLCHWLVYTGHAIPLWLHRKLTNIFCTYSPHLLMIYSLEHDDHITYWSGCVIMTTPWLFSKVQVVLIYSNTAVTHRAVKPYIASCIENSINKVTRWMMVL